MERSLDSTEVADRFANIYATAGPKLIEFF